MAEEFARAGQLTPHPEVRTLALVRGGLRVVVLDERNGMAHRLEGVVAAAWIVLDRPTGLEELRETVCSALSLPPETGGELVDGALALLWRQGLLEGSDAPTAPTRKTPCWDAESGLLRREPDP